MEIFPAKTPLPEAAEDAEPEEELNLELSLGPIGDPKPPKPAGGWPAEAVALAATVDQGSRKGFSFVDLTGVPGDGRAEMEARMVEARTRDRLAREEQEEALSLDRRRFGVAGAVKVPYAMHPQPFSPMFPYHHHPQHQHLPHQVQYMPVPASDYGYGFPYVMPYWAPANAPATAAGAEACPPAACRGFPVPMPIGSGGVTEMKAYGKAVGINGVFARPVDSPGSSASGVSDHRSSRIQGGSISSSSESRSHSSLHRSPDAQPTPPQSSQVTAEDGADKSTLPALVTQPSLSAAAAAAPPAMLAAATAAPAVAENLQDPAAALAEKKKTTMVSPPRVSATGDGPNGRTVSGFLYKYTKSEVMIVCVCHGAFFTPADFVLHAGGTDVSQPLKQIVMIDA